MNNHTAKHFVLQLGSLISLYLSIAFFLTLSFGLINIYFTDLLESVWELDSAASSIRLGFAMVLVFLPTYLVLTRMVNKNRRTSTDSNYLGLTKWLIYLSLLVAGFTLLGDLVAVVMGFLEGELTMRFILKALTVFVVTGAAFYYYALDAKGYWLKNEHKSVIYGAAVTLVVVTVMVVSIAHIPNPTEVREMKADQQKVTDLQDMQWRIEDYYRANQALPSDLQTLYSEFAVPVPPGELGVYVYETTGDTTYKLCTTFIQDMSGTTGSYAADRAVIAPSQVGNYNWDYKAGDWCFERVIDQAYLK